MRIDMLKTSFLFLLTILAPFASSQGAETWTGYKPTVQVQSPFKAVATSSVMQLQTVALTEQAVRNHEQIVFIDINKARQFTAEELATSNAALQIETCRRQNITQCPLLNAGYVGSGIINNGNELYTCRHMVQDWTSLAARKNNLDVNQISPPLRILDINKKIVYNSATSAQLLKFSLINADKRLLFPINSTTDTSMGDTGNLISLSDVVQLKSLQNLIPAQPLTLATAPKEGDLLYNSGFPGPTNFFNGAAGDTDGSTMVSSSGEVLLTVPEQMRMITSNFASAGISGGIVTKEDGSFVAMVCADALDARDNSPVSISYFLDSTGLQNLWKSLE